MGQINLENLLGFSESSAKKMVESYGLKYRVTKVDLTQVPVTRDVKADRVNVELENGKVSRAYVG